MIQITGLLPPAAVGVLWQVQLLHYYYVTAVVASVIHHSAPLQGLNPAQLKCSTALADTPTRCTAPQLHLSRYL